MNVTEKILRAHLVSGEPVVGQEVGIRIDQTLTQDATGTMAYLQFESMGIDRAKTELSVSYVDHNTVQIGFENADDHDYLQSVAKKYGIVYSKPGNGICHQLHLERFGKPGKTLIGSDVAMGGGPYYIAWPKVVGIRLTGKLQPGVSAKDVILAVLRRFGSKGNVGKVFEYFGPGLATLDVPSRATIANMGAELGVTTSVFPSDDVTRAFLKAQGREQDWAPLTADDETYDETWELDLSTLEPLAAAPHNPGNIETIAEHVGQRVNQIMIGSCTNSSYRDIKTVALLLKGKQVHPDVEVGIACGSKQVVRMLADEGLLGALVGAGCRILENACGFCIGAHMSPSTDAVCLRTSNRNFEGRSGTQSAKVYLVSPATSRAAPARSRPRSTSSRPRRRRPRPSPAPSPTRARSACRPWPCPRPSPSTTGCSSTARPPAGASPKRPSCAARTSARCPPASRFPSAWRVWRPSRSATRSPPTTSCPPAPA